MKNIKKYVALAITGILTLSLAGCSIIERTPESIQKTVIAKVNGEKITRGSLDLVMKSELDQYAQQYGANFAEEESIKETLRESQLKYIDYLVDEKVLLKKAEDFDVVPSEDEISSYVDENEDTYKGYFNGEQTQYEEYLESIGQTTETFKELLRTQCIINNAIDEMVKDITASEDELKEYYEENKDTFKDEPGAEVTHILFTGDNAEEQSKKAKELATSGKTFKEISEMDEFKETANVEELGHVNFENSGLVTEFEEAFKVLPVNRVSEPVKTSFGWHLILNTAVNSEDVIPTFEDKKTEIEQVVLNTKKQAEYTEKLKQYKEEMKVEIFEKKL